MTAWPMSRMRAPWSARIEVSEWVTPDLSWPLMWMWRTRESGKRGIYIDFTRHERKCCAGGSNDAGGQMHHVDTGQCGLCTHFGETHKPDGMLMEIRSSHEAPEDLVDDCGHPKHASLHLRVTPISGCDGF